jgi:hypothetical protein
MKKIILGLISSILSAACFAQTTPLTEDQKISFPLTKWVSKNANDPITIQNGAGLPIVVLINLNKDSSSVAIKNCGTVSKIDPGSSAVCTTTDAINPVTITSESASLAAEGDYQIKQQ